MGERNLAASSHSSRRCQIEGCTKYAKRAQNGVSLYCKAHMKEAGLQPAVGSSRAWQPPVCGRYHRLTYHNIVSMTV
jgi:hypothetical protein